MTVPFTVTSLPSYGVEVLVPWTAEIEMTVSVHSSVPEVDEGDGGGPSGARKGTRKRAVERVWHGYRAFTSAAKRP